MDENRGRIRSAYFEFSSARHGSGVKKLTTPAVGFFYVSPVPVPVPVPVTVVPISSSLALKIFDFLITYGVCKKRKFFYAYCFFLFT